MSDWQSSLGRAISMLIQEPYITSALKNGLQGHGKISWSVRLLFHGTASFGTPLDPKSSNLKEMKASDLYRGLIYQSIFKLGSHGWNIYEHDRFGCKANYFFVLSRGRVGEDRMTAARLLALAPSDYAAKTWAPDDRGHQGGGVVEDKKRSETGGYDIALRVTGSIISECSSHMLYTEIMTKVQKLTTGPRPVKRMRIERQMGKS